MTSPTKAKIHLGPSEHVIAAVPQYASGPGWSNALIWVYIEDKLTGKVRSEDIQPEDQTPGMFAAFRVCNAAHELMMHEVAGLIKKG